MGLRGTSGEEGRGQASWGLDIEVVRTRRNWGVGDSSLRVLRLRSQGGLEIGPEDSSRSDVEIVKKDRY